MTANLGSSFNGWGYPTAMTHRLCFHIIAGLCLSISACCGALAQQAQTEGEFWPAIDVHYQFSDNLRLLGLTELKRGAELGYQQIDAGLGLGYRWKTIKRPHLENIDPDKEHTFLVGGGYEYLHTVSGKPKYENRLALEAQAGTRPLSRLLIRDRNRVEFRWVNGVYSTRYRNNLSLEYDISAGKFRFTPYTSAEAFYDGAKGSWNQEQYTAGAQWPYKRRLMLETYYLRQHCTTCSPVYLNVAGLTLNFYFRNVK